jgi:hypothetical protein
MAFKPALQTVLVCFLPRQDPAVDGKLAYRSIGMTRLAVEGDPHRSAAGKLEPRRALDVDEKGVHRVVEPGKLKATAVQRAGLDLSAVEEWLQALRGPSREPDIRVPGRGTLLVADISQVVRAPIDRDAEVARARPARAYLRLEIAGDEAAGDDAMRCEMPFEEAFGLIAVEFARRRCKADDASDSATTDAEGRVFGV